MALVLAALLIALLTAAATGRLPDTRDGDYAVGKILRPSRTRTQ